MRRFKSLADLDFSLRFDGVMSTSMSKLRDFSGERPSTVARRVGRGLSNEKAERGCTSGLASEGVTRLESSTEVPNDRPLWSALDSASGWKT
jgi:hypothetical protein